MASLRPKKREIPGVFRAVLAGLGLTTLLALVALGAAGCSDDALAEARKAEEAGDLAQATTVYGEYVEAHPDDLEALKELAAILYIQRRWNEALPVQERVVALDPAEALIRVELGFNYLNHQMLADRAVIVFQEASAIEPTAQYLSFLAQAQVGAGDEQAAEASLRDALATDKTYPHTYALLTALLEEQGRTDEAAALRRTAESEGVALESAAATQ